MAKSLKPQKQVLFERGDEGFKVFRIPALETTNKGTLLATCEARMSRSDWSCKALVYRRSEDGGKTWSKLQEIVSVPKDTTNEGNGQNKKDVVLNNPLFIVDEDNVVHFLYCESYMRAYHCVSTDDGKTFSKAKEITDTFEKFRERDGIDWNVIATGPGAGIQLRSGRLVAPIWIGYGKGKSHRPNTCGTIYSDDKGQTWEAGDILSPEYKEEMGNLNENQAVELADGSVMLNMRSHSSKHRRAYTISKDGAHDWSEPKHIEDLFEPICMASTVRLTTKNEDVATKNRLLFSNPSSDKIFTFHRRQSGIFGFSSCTNSGQEHLLLVRTGQTGVFSSPQDLLRPNLLCEVFSQMDYQRKRAN